MMGDGDIDIYAGLSPSKGGSNQLCNGEKDDRLKMPPPPSPCDESSVSSTFDLYSDLIEEEENKPKEVVAKLQEVNEENQSKIGNLASKIEDLQKENQTLQDQNAALKKNISALLKTAKMEMKRKDWELMQLKLRKKNDSRSHFSDHHVPTQDEGSRRMHHPDRINPNLMPLGKQRQLQHTASRDQASGSRNSPDTEIGPSKQQALLEESSKSPTRKRIPRGPHTPLGEPPPSGSSAENSPGAARHQSEKARSRSPLRNLPHFKRPLVYERSDHDREKTVYGARLSKVEHDKSTSGKHDRTDESRTRERKRKRGGDDEDTLSSSSSQTRRRDSKRDRAQRDQKYRDQEKDVERIGENCRRRREKSVQKAKEALYLSNVSPTKPGKMREKYDQLRRSRAVSKERELRRSSRAVSRESDLLRSKSSRRRDKRSDEKEDRFGFDLRGMLSERLNKSSRNDDETRRKQSSKEKKSGSSSRERDGKHRSTGREDGSARSSRHRAEESLSRDARSRHPERKVEDNRELRSSIVINNLEDGELPLERSLPPSKRTKKDHSYEVPRSKTCSGGEEQLSGSSKKNGASLDTAKRKENIEDTTSSLAELEKDSSKAVKSIDSTVVPFPSDSSVICKPQSEVKTLDGDKEEPPKSKPHSIEDDIQACLDIGELIYEEELPEQDAPAEDRYSTVATDISPTPPPPPPPDSPAAPPPPPPPPSDSPPVLPPPPPPLPPTDDQMETDIEMQNQVACESSLKDTSVSSVSTVTKTPQDVSSKSDGDVVAKSPKAETANVKKGKNVDKELIDSKTGQQMSKTKQNTTEESNTASSIYEEQHNSSVENKTVGKESSVSNEQHIELTSRTKDTKDKIPASSVNVISKPDSVQSDNAQRKANSGQLAAPVEVPKHPVCKNLFQDDDAVSSSEGHQHMVAKSDQNVPTSSKLPSSSKESISSNKKDSTVSADTKSTATKEVLKRQCVDSSEAMLKQKSSTQPDVSAQKTSGAGESTQSRIEKKKIKKGEMPQGDDTCSIISSSNGSGDKNSIENSKKQPFTLSKSSVSTKEAFRKDQKDIRTLSNAGNSKSSSKGGKESAEKIKDKLPTLSVPPAPSNEALSDRKDDKVLKEVTKRHNINKHEGLSKQKPPGQDSSVLSKKAVSKTSTEKDRSSQTRDVGKGTVTQGELSDDNGMLVSSGSKEGIEKRKEKVPTSSKTHVPSKTLVPTKTTLKDKTDSKVSKQATKKQKTETSKALVTEKPPTQSVPSVPVEEVLLKSYDEKDSTQSSIDVKHVEGENSKGKVTASKSSALTQQCCQKSAYLKNVEGEISEGKVTPSKASKASTLTQRSCEKNADSKGQGNQTVANETKSTSNLKESAPRTSNITVNVKEKSIVDSKQTETSWLKSTASDDVASTHGEDKNVEIKKKSDAQTTVSSISVHQEVPVTPTIRPKPAVSVTPSDIHSIKLSFMDEDSRSGSPPLTYEFSPHFLETVDAPLRRLSTARLVDDAEDMESHDRIGSSGSSDSKGSGCHSEISNESSNVGISSTVFSRETKSQDKTINEEIPTNSSSNLKIGEVSNVPADVVPQLNKNSLSNHDASSGSRLDAKTNQGTSDSFRKPQSSKTFTIGNLRSARSTQYDPKHSKERSGVEKLTGDAKATTSYPVSAEKLKQLEAQAERALNLVFSSRFPERIRQLKKQAKGLKSSKKQMKRLQKSTKSPRQLDVHDSSENHPVATKQSTVTSNNNLIASSASVSVMASVPGKVDKTMSSIGGDKVVKQPVVKKGANLQKAVVAPTIVTVAPDDILEIHSTDDNSLLDEVFQESEVRTVAKVTTGKPSGACKSDRALETSIPKDRFTDVRDTRDRTMSKVERSSRRDESKDPKDRSKVSRERDMGRKHSSSKSRSSSEESRLRKAGNERDDKRSSSKSRSSSEESRRRKSAYEKDRKKSASRDERDIDRRKDDRSSNRDRRGRDSREKDRRSDSRYSSSSSERWKSERDRDNSRHEGRKDEKSKTPSSDDIKSIIRSVSVKMASTIDTGSGQSKERSRKPDESKTPLRLDRSQLGPWGCRDLREEYSPAEKENQSQLASKTNLTEKQSDDKKSKEALDDSLSEGEIVSDSDEDDAVICNQNKRQRISERGDSRVNPSIRTRGGRGGPTRQSPRLSSKSRSRREEAFSSRGSGRREEGARKEGSGVQTRGSGVRTRGRKRRP